MGKRSYARLLGWLLAFALTVTSALPGFGIMQAEAADTKVWCHMTGAGSGHAYSDPSATGAAFLHHKTETMPVGGKLSITYALDENSLNGSFGFFYTYLDDNNWLYIGYDNSSKWYYQYKLNGAEEYPKLAGFPEPTAGRTNIEISLNNEVMTVKMGEFSGNVAKDALKQLAEKINGQGKFGFRAHANVGLRFTDVMVNTKQIPEGKDEWQFLAERSGQTLTEQQTQVFTVNGKVVNEQGAAIENATVRLGQEKGRTAADGTYSIPNVEEGEYSVSASAKGYQPRTLDQNVTVDADKTLADIELKEKEEVSYTEDQYISNFALRVAVSKTFPQVHQYEIGTGEDRKIFYGQETPLTKIRINDVNITPEMGQTVISGTSAEYPMTLKDEAANIDLAMKVKISVPENTEDSLRNLTWEVTELTKNAGCAKIQSIEVPDLNLVTITEDQSGTQLMGANDSGDVNTSGDEEVTFDKKFIADTSKGYAYGFLSGDGLSAGVWSNSEMNGDKRLVCNNGVDSMSLTSAAWFHDYHNESGFDFSKDEYTQMPVSELPCAKVCLAEDLNDDGIVDWQDGAIAYRDIMNNPYGSENTKNLVNYRISMNFSSQATNPYLKVADNIKKVYLATDGLPQAVMMKGYGSEGHDSANSEYGHVSDRLGGIEELKQLNVIAHQYNTQTGIHINAHEAYTESRSFCDELIIGPGSLGWGWLDKSYNINRAYDLGSGLRYKRLLQLYDRLNDTKLYKNQWPNAAGQGPEYRETIAGEETIAATVAENLDNPEDLDFMYLDVWHGDSWETRKIAQQFNSLGWRFSTEFGNIGEYDTTWNHWATEGSYGGASGKGFNSDVMRFIRNHQKDSFILNWPAYGGAADNPLLGGYDLAGFEGWGSNNNFDEYITRTFAINLPTKFLQHYKVYKWENYPENENGMTTSPVGNHEKQITLRSDADENGNYDTVVVTRNEEQRPAVNSNQFGTNYNFVERTITLNGKTVLNDVEYLLPWYDEEKQEEKLYYYNYDGYAANAAATEWELPDGWTNLSNVKVYELTDMGRGEEKTVSVTGGKVTFAKEWVKANTPYVVVKGDSAVPKRTVGSWSDHAHVTDSGFNSYAGTGNGDALNADVWSGDITEAKVVRVSSGNKYLQMGSETKKQSVSTKITGLKANKHYAAQVYVDNKSDAKASIKVTSDGKETSRYTLKSIAGNYVRSDAHNINAVSGIKMQVMLVAFETGENTEAELTLEREAGSGITYFDDIRIVEKTLTDMAVNGVFKEDFESLVGGIYPFVVGPMSDVNDNLVHLSEKHAPYTQSGWGNMVLDDVLDGDWSLKYHRYLNEEGLMYRTIPQNLRFEPGVTYEISFDYQAGCENSFYVVTGDGDTQQNADSFIEQTPYDSAAKKTTSKKYTFQMTGAESGQSWFGIATARPSVSGHYGQVDFVLDNLVVKKESMAWVTDSHLDTLMEALTEVDAGQGYCTKASWDAYREAYNAAREEAEKETPDEAQLTRLTEALKTARESLEIDLDKATADFAEAKAQIDAGQGYYTDASWQALAGAYAAADAEVKKPGADPRQAEGLGAELKEALESLILDAEKIKTDEILPAVNAAEQKIAAGEGKYEAEGWNAYKAAFAALKAEAEKAIPDPETLLQLKKALTDAEANLKLITNTGGEPNQPGQPDQPGQPNQPGQPEQPGQQPAPSEPIQKGGTYKDKKNEYKVLDAAKKTVTLTKSLAKKSSKKLTIPAKVKINGVNCTVTVIGKNAFKGYSKATSVVIPKNVTKIEGSAFAGCKKLKKVEFKNAKVTVSKNAFKGAPSKATVKVPAALKKNKKNLNKFKSMVKKAGLKNAKVK